MYDSVTHDFDRVSTPLQGQQDEQPEAVNSAEKMPLIMMQLTY